MAGGGATDGSPVGALTKINLIRVEVAEVMEESEEVVAVDGMAVPGDVNTYPFGGYGGS